jgi:hypothetical protein
MAPEQLVDLLGCAARNCGDVRVRLGPLLLYGVANARDVAQANQDAALDRRDRVGDGAAN